MVLNKEEEYRLANILGVVRIDKQRGVKYADEYTIEAVEWLATMLKAINGEAKAAFKEIEELRKEILKLKDELGKTTEELQSANRTIGNLSDELYGKI